jgi:hypothetical protein
MRIACALAAAAAMLTMPRAIPSAQILPLLLLLLLLLQLRDAFKPNPAKRAFWQQLMEQQLGPISNDEAAGAGVTRAAAEEYVRLHGAAQLEAPGAMCLNSPQHAVPRMQLSRHDCRRTSCEPVMVVLA